MSFDLQPNLKGELIDLRPLSPEDWNDLFAVASDRLIWEQHPESDRYKEDVFKAFFREALECGGAFVIIDKMSQQIIGSTRFYGYDPEKSEIEIGWTFLARNYWGGRFIRASRLTLPKQLLSTKRIKIASESWVFGLFHFRLSQNFRTPFSSRIRPWSWRRSRSFPSWECQAAGPKPLAWRMRSPVIGR